MAKTAKPKPHVTLDMKGAACPGPMLGARRVLDDLLAGEVLLLISDCPATKDDLFSWPKYADVEILKTEKLARGGTGAISNAIASAARGAPVKEGVAAFGELGLTGRLRAAAQARSEVISPSAAMWRCSMPVRCTIHSSLVSTVRDTAGRAAKRRSHVAQISSLRVNSI